MWRTGNNDNVSTKHEGKKISRGSKNGIRNSLFLVFLLVAVMYVCMALVPFHLTYMDTKGDHSVHSVLTTFQSEDVGEDLSPAKDPTEKQTPNDRRSATMILAAAPLDKRHVTALWSELNCFTRDEHLVRVLIAAPSWAESIILRIVEESKRVLPQFSSNKVTLEAMFFQNDRYDVGLWCDGLKHLKENTSNAMDDVVLLNDSLFALRPFTGILDAIRGTYPESEKSHTAPNDTVYTTSKHMTSLSYSYMDPKGLWLESVYRAFDKIGIAKYQEHSCHDVTHASFCTHLTDSREKKKCLVQQHEIAIARLFQRQDILGLYPSDVPEDQWHPEKPFVTWSSHMEYWRDTLVQKFNFPAAKVSKRNMIKTMKNPLIQECTAGFNRTMFEKEADVFDFSVGVRTIQRNGQGKVKP